MKKLTDAQRTILAAMADGAWWIPNNFQHPVVYIHYQAAYKWALPKLKALRDAGLIEQRENTFPDRPDYCFRITQAGRDAIK